MLEDNEDKTPKPDSANDSPDANKYRDADIITPFNLEDYEGREITVTLAKNQFSKSWVAQRLTMAQFIDMFCVHGIGAKEGRAAVFADMVPGQRLKPAVKEITCLALDIDNGVQRHVLDTALKALGCIAFRYTSHSNGKRSSEIRKDDLLNFHKDADDITAEMIREYLTVKARWYPSIVQTVEFVEEEHTDKGRVCRIAHDPMEKHRVVIPLERPFVIQDQGRTQPVAWAKWAKAIEALAGLLGVPFDRSCIDPARLYYLARHDEDRPYSISLFGGALFDFQSLRLDGVFDNVSAEFAKSGGSKSVTPWGKAHGKWWRTYAHGFQIMDVIEHHCPDRKRSKASAGYNIECPFDSDHSNAGDTQDQACFAVNAAETGWNEFFIVKCQHAGCQDKTSLDMLAKMIEEEWFPESEITNPDFNIAEIEDAPDANTEVAVSDGYGGALAFEPNTDAIPRGVSYDKETGFIHKTFRNALLLIGSEQWDMGYNELTQTHGLRGDVGFPWPLHLGYALNDSVRREIRLYLLRRWDVTFSTENVYEATMTLARRNNFNPVCEYLDEVEAKWDGKPRVDRWLETYMGVKATKENAAYVRDVGKIVFVAGVRRARQPGCKFDELLTLEGPQGGGKSAAVGILGGDFYSDAKLGDLENTQKVGMKLRGTWIQEFGELAGLTKAEVDDVKDFLSKRADRFKQPYGRSEDDYPRRCIFIGTVNPGGGAYLVDLTGNRRFWPVACGEIDLEALARDRDQLWAEAAMMESRGDAIRLNPSLYAVAKAEQDARLAEDPWVEILADYLEGRRKGGETRVLSMTLLSAALELPVDKRTQAAMKKLKAAMTFIPAWEYKATTRADGGRSSGYEYVGA